MHTTHHTIHRAFPPRRHLSYARTQAREVQWVVSPLFFFLWAISCVKILYADLSNEESRPQQTPTLFAGRGENTASDEAAKTLYDYIPSVATHHDHINQTPTRLPGKTGYVATAEVAKTFSNPSVATHHGHIL